MLSRRRDVNTSGPTNEFRAQNTALAIVNGVKSRKGWLRTYNAGETVRLFYVELRVT